MQEITLGRHETGRGSREIEIAVADRTAKLTLNLNFASHRFIYDVTRSGHPYEQETVSALAETLLDGDVFFDVGAHCGYFSAIGGALVGPLGRVFSFEPDNVNADQLALNCPKATIVRRVVSDKSGYVDFYTNADNDGGHCLWPPGAHPHNIESRNVPHVAESVRLDDYAHAYPKAIKIDTEGAECLVLRGAEMILRQPQLKLVVCEINDFGMHQLGLTSAEIFYTMNQHGFTSAFQRDGRNVTNAIFRRWARTHCPVGHELTKENTYAIRNLGIETGRACRICRKKTRNMRGKK